ncbi:MAG: prepilin-type N-terminal cleavage/methylation domain-containing protein [Candidatus Eisenbacteria sp.]|nr:prepilin-type N-terminal cleavage/methylation domain-containing protein [Candidatus Eisenbacteria bacterium]
MLRRNQRGFTLVELMIVVIIVGILAAVAIPMYQGATERAKASEAVAALGTIRGAMRVYYAEHGTYVGASFTDGALVTNGSVLDVSDNDLLGRYFSSPCYTFNGAPLAATFSLECDGGVLGNVAPYASEVSGIVRTINQQGDIS